MQLSVLLCFLSKGKLLKLAKLKAQNSYLKLLQMETHT